MAEPGVDLAVLAAVAGVVDATVIDDRTVVIGEVGLGGEVRGVAHAALRVAEAARLGFTRVVGPASLPRVAGVEIVGVDTVAAALAAALRPVERRVVAAGRPEFDRIRGPRYDVASCVPTRCSPP